LSKLVGVLADIHGDIFALDAALARLRAMGCDQILCAGDLVDIEPFGEEVVQRLKAEKGVICILGNHDRWALEFGTGGRTRGGSSSPARSRM
jgi:predicted phosphodiesterase